MPGPFPGMDPYLEDPLLWPGVHQSLITFIRGELNEHLPDNYVADIGERVYVELQERSVYPNVSISERIDQSSSGGGVAVLSDPYTRILVEPVQMREVFVEVRSLKQDLRIVTTIEVLSPSNKRAGSEGRDLYLRKEEALLQSDSHLMEIDLLRAGEHTVAAPEGKLESRGRRDYLVLLHRYTKRWEFWAWPNRIRERLPRVSVPLLPGDPDVVFDLQKCFDQTYDNGPYRRRVDYGKEPTTPLAPDDAAWADALLREKGLRRAD
jgi:hypothetical protein